MFQLKNGTNQNSSNILSIRVQMTGCQYGGCGGEGWRLEVKASGECVKQDMDLHGLKQEWN